MEHILSDPHQISANGQLLSDIVHRNGLIVVNSTSKCFGTITRIRKTNISEEKSVIDYFIVCSRFFELISSMVVDEDRKYVLTKYSSRFGTKCVVKSDHNPLICTLNIKWDRRIKIERKEIFKLKDIEGLQMFKDITSNCPKLVQLSQKSSNFLNDAEQWMKQIRDIMQTCFKKIRITGKGKPLDSEIEILMKAKQKMATELSKIAGQNIEGQDQIKRNIDMIENEISIICAEKNTKIVKEHLAELSGNEDQVCRLNMWRLKQKLCPRSIDPPMAKKKTLMDN